MAGDLHATPIESEQISRLEYDASCPLSLAFDRDEAHRWDAAPLRKFPQRQPRRLLTLKEGLHVN
jgi:hypothetical protein